MNQDEGTGLSLLTLFLSIPITALALPPTVVWLWTDDVIWMKLGLTAMSLGVSVMALGVLMFFGSMFLPALQGSEGDTQ